MKKNIFVWLGVGICSLVFCSCEGFFGKEIDTDFIDEPVFDNREIAYVPIQPVWDGFSRPVDIIAGWDNLVYIADAGTEEIISLDQAGTELGRFPIPGLLAIAQDRSLDILALGHLDTMINDRVFRLPTVYRIDQNNIGPYGLDNGRIAGKVVHPFYFKSGTPTSGDEAVSFRGITILRDNRYYLVRSGPSNNPRQFGGPDDAVLRFSANDAFESPIVITTSSGPLRDYFKAPAGISTTIGPPQSLDIDRLDETQSNLGDFVFTSLDPSLALKVQYIDFQKGDLGSNFVQETFAQSINSTADRILYEANRFGRPMDVSLATDGTGNIFVVDAERDSLYQFNRFGQEGIIPPQGFPTDKAINTSFGGRGEGLMEFNEPSGVVYFDQIVYVADAGNGRILRFKLTLDFD